MAQIVFRDECASTVWHLLHLEAISGGSVQGSSQSVALHIMFVFHLKYFKYPTVKYSGEGY